jgi:hypothetical protein
MKINIVPAEVLVMTGRTSVIQAEEGHPTLSAPEIKNHRISP